MTGAEPWLGELTRALRRENLDGWHVDQVIAETRAHLTEIGEEPESAVGAADAYARVVAAELAGAVEPPSVAPPRLVVEGVTKSYRRRPVLDDVDLVVAAGEVVAVVGPNGAGTSILLRICAGLDSPDAGRVTVHGALRYCPQQPAPVDLLRADEHVELVGAGRGLSRDEARRAGAELAAFTELAGQAIDPRLRLSGFGTFELLAGRVLGLWCLAVPLIAVCSAVIPVGHGGLPRWAGGDRRPGAHRADRRPVRAAGRRGAARRPLESAMLLLVVSGLQVILDPFGLAARFVPFWSVREPGTWTVDGTDRGYLRRALLHAAAAVVLLGALTVLARVRALRRRPHLRVIGV